MSTIKSLFDLPTQFKGYEVVEVATSFPVCPFKDIIGVEVEVENYDSDVAYHRPHHSGWDIAEDGSLRNRGREFISVPTHANTIHSSLAALLEQHLDCKVQSFSPRTSIHVHVNCRDLELTTVQDIIRYYTLFERMMYRFCGRSRYKNIYCVPLIDTDLFAKWPILFSNMIRWPKYTGLNAGALGRLGTLEFRHMHGTYDGRKVMRWITLILSIFNHVKNMDSKEVAKELQSCADEVVFLTLLSKVFGDLSTTLLYKSAEDYIHNYNYVMSSFMDVKPLVKLDKNNSSFFKRLK